MERDPPLFFYMRFEPERPASPAEAADVLQSIDDMYRLADRYWNLYGKRGGLERVWPRRPDPAENPDELVRLAFGGGGPESPLVADQIRFGSPLEVVTEIPWEVYAVGGAPTFWFFIERIEKIWNMRKRIRVESKRLDAEAERYDREYWEEKLRKTDAETIYWLRRRAGSGRFDQGGVAEPGAFLGSEGTIADERPILGSPPRDQGTTSE